MDELQNVDKRTALTASGSKSGECAC